MVFKLLGINDKRVIKFSENLFGYTMLTFILLGALFFISVLGYNAFLFYKMEANFILENKIEEKYLFLSQEDTITFPMKSYDLNQLSIESDSIVKAPNSFNIYIYRKTPAGDYKPYKKL